MLRSVLQTSLSGVSAASNAIGITANNLAGATIDGFKPSRAIFADQSSQSHSLGRSGVGGTAFIGRGVMVSAIERDHSQGAIVLSNDPLDLALDGPGYFVLEGAGGQRQYTRDGKFHFNADGEWVTPGGARLMGHNADRDYQIDTGRLEAIRPPRGPTGDGVRLSRIDVGEDGTLKGQYENGEVRELGRIRIAEFTNPGGLISQGQSVLTEGAGSGQPSTSSFASTRIVTGARELSGTDIGSELVNLSLYSTAFRANLHVLGVGTSLLDELFQLNRF